MQASKRRKREPIELIVLKTYLNWVESNSHITVSVIRLLCKELHGGERLRTNLAGITLENLAQYEELGADRFELCPVAIRNRDFEFVKAVLGKSSITDNLMTKLQYACADIDDLDMFARLKNWAVETNQPLNLHWDFFSYAGAHSALLILEFLELLGLDVGSKDAEYNDPSIATLKKFPPPNDYLWEKSAICVIKRNDFAQFEEMVKIPQLPIEILGRLEHTVLKTDNVKIVERWYALTERTPNMHYSSIVGLNVLRWLVDIKTPQLEKYRDFAKLTLKKDIQLFERIFGTEFDRYDNEFARIALETGYKTLEDLKDGFYEFEPSDIVKAVEANFNLETITWMYSHRNSKEQDFLGCWSAAVKFPTPTLMDWVLKVMPRDQHPQLWSRMQESTLENAKWFYERRPEGLHLLFQEPQYPNIEIVIWALEISPLYSYYAYYKSHLFGIWELAMPLQSKYNFPGIHHVGWGFTISDASILTWLVKEKIHDFSTLRRGVIKSENNDRLDLMKILLSYENATVIVGTEGEQLAKKFLNESVYRWFLSQCVEPK